MVSYDVYGWHLWVSFFYFPLTLFPLSYFWRGAVWASVCAAGTFLQGPYVWVFLDPIWGWTRRVFLSCR